MGWDAVSQHLARATLVDGGVRITMLFSFNDSEMIDSVRADARGRTIGNQVVATPWQGRFWNYQVRQGMSVPVDGEAAWLPQGGAQPYWRGSITEITYDLVK